MVYPILETLKLREMVNDLLYTGADIDLGRIAELLTLNRISSSVNSAFGATWVVAPFAGMMTTGV